MKAQVETHQETKDKIGREMSARHVGHNVHSIIRRAQKLRAETLRGRVLFGKNTAKREQLRMHTPACTRRGQCSLAPANVERGKSAGQTWSAGKARDIAL